jgi:hypothetical protein
VKIRLQKEGESVKNAKAEKKYKNIFNAFRVVYIEEGMYGLFKGLSASLAREATYSTLR